MLARHEIDEVGHVLLEAADYMETHGHCKHTWRDLKTGNVCALGAIGMSTWSNLTTTSQREAIKRLSENIPWVKGTYTHASERNPTPTCKIADWNNAPERTSEEVLAKFREVAYDPKYAKVTV